MPLDHSALQEPRAIRTEVTGVAVDTAVVVTPPRWAHSVDIGAPDGAVLVGTSGTEGVALTHRFTVAAGRAYNLPLQTPVSENAAAPFLVQTSNTAHTVEFTYLPKDS